MWRWNAMVVALMLTPCVPRPSVAGDARQSLVCQHKWTRFEIVLGRITAFHLRGGQSHCATSADSEHLPRESISVNGDATSPAFRYERFDGSRTLTIEIIDRCDVEIRQQPVEQSAEAAVEFLQPREGPLRLEVEDGSGARVYEGLSLWHLLLAEPDVCQKYLIPALSVLRPNWRLIDKATQIEAELFDATSTHPTIARQHVAAAVAQLDHREFARRQAADRRLRDFGVAVLPYLSRLDQGMLSVEQRMRVERIRERLNVPVPDTAERAGAWLSNDRAVWLELLSHREPAKRKAAAKRLTDIHPGLVQFDPLADESLRQKQIALLRYRLGAAY